MKELNQYRDMLYWNHQEIVKALRSDINAYLPKILAKRRAIAVGLHKILGNPSILYMRHDCYILLRGLEAA